VERSLAAVTEDEMHLAIDIPHDEWLEAARVLTMVESDERSVLGMVALSCDGLRRRWWGSDSYRLATVSGDVDEREYSLLVSPRLIHLAVATAAGGSAELVLSDEGGFEAVSVQAGDVSLSIAADHRSYPDVDATLASQLQVPGATVEVDVRQLAELVRWARHLPIDPTPEDEEPLFWVGLDDGTLTIAIDWAGLGGTEYRVSADGSGRARVAVRPQFFANALELFDDSESAELIVPHDPTDTVRIHGGTRTALIMPVDTSFERRRSRVEAVLVDVFGPDVTHRDQDGDYELGKADGIRVFARLKDDQPVRLQVFGVLVDGIDCSEELVSELNDYNAVIGFARCFWIDRQVLVEVDLVAETLDAEEVIAAYDRIASAGGQLGPMVSTIYGGHMVVNDQDQRWNDYRNATILAEVSPGAWAPLNGPEASTDAWPYRDVVHVLTAFNPRGQQRSAESNARADTDLVALLHENGVSFQRARGGGGDYWEDGVLVWGLGREDARAIGRRFQQDAIFELDERAVQIVGCFTDRVDEVSRVAPAGR
jgi:hypothetical protein